MSAAPSICTTCTVQMPADSPLGICPSCLIATTLGQPETTQSAGPYSLLEKIGEGSYGEVFIGEQTDPIHREAAVKLLKIDHLDGPAAQRFQAEAQALALLDHPNIARLYEAGVTSEQRPYLALELIPGVALTAWCDSQNFDIDARVTIFKKICAAMDHAHQRGLIHRDLKPENILVDPESGEPKVIDFGIARSTTTLLHDSAMLTGAHDIMGTPAYLSPEQTDGGNAVLDARTDVYSLGAVLYTLLTGQNVIEACGTSDSHFELLKTIREIDPPRADKLNTNITTNLANAIRKAMAKSPQNRFGSAAEFSSALDAAPLETSRTKRRLAIGVAALLLAGLVALPFIKLPFGSAGQTPPTTEAVAIHGFQAPFTLLESGYHKPPAETERIPPFSEQSRFCWFVYRDANGDEFNFSFDSFYESPSCGEFVFGAKGADLPGAVHLIPGSAEDEILWNLLNTEKSEAELKRLEEIQWDEPSLDKQTRDAKTFEGQIYELRARRSSRLDLGTWPIR